MKEVKYIPGDLVKQEIWKPIHGYEGYYEISNLGRVKSLQRIEESNNGLYEFRLRREKFLKQEITKEGYKNVRLSKKGERHSFRVHRLVASAFIPNPNNFPCVNHKDMIRDNNIVDNLEWCTVAYNNQYGNAGEKRSNALRGKIYKQFWRKVAQYNTDGSLVKVWDSITQAHKHTGIGHISEVCCGAPHCKTAGGYIWKHIT